MKPVVDAEYLIEWSMTHERCAACRVHASVAVFDWPGQGVPWRRGLHTHHLIKRSRVRIDRGWNLLRLCPVCHAAAENERIIVNDVRVPPLTLANCLWLKQEADPDEWMPDFLESALGRRLPGVESPPDWFMKERLRSP